MTHDDAFRHYRIPVQLTPSIGAFYSAQHMAINFTVAGPFSDADMNDPAALKHAGRGASLFLVNMELSYIDTLAEGVRRGRIGITTPELFSMRYPAPPSLKDICPAQPLSAYHQRKAERTRIYQEAIEKKTARMIAAKGELAFARDEAKPHFPAEHWSDVGIVPRSLATLAAKDALPSIAIHCTTPGNGERAFGWIRDRFAEAMAKPADRIKQCEDGSIRSDSGYIQMGGIRDNHTQELAYQQINLLRGDLTMLRSQVTDSMIDGMCDKLLELTRLIKLTEKK
ncbi:hypothetical protein [Pseudomonas sp.]|uniref:hypothetical protein n=1 Tax=Pseudomonas sp. TaxID=306 RepID=UPI003FD88CE7